MKRIFCALLVGATLVSAVLTGCGSDNDKKGSEGATQWTVTPDNSQSAQSSTEQQASDAETKAAGEKVKINDSQLGEIEITVADGVELYKYNNDGFSEENGLKIYNENGSKVSLSGIDVSENCGDIDWAKVKAAGIDFVMVRLGGRGYGSEGSLYSDEKAKEYIQGAQSQGIKTGGYFFSQAVNDGEAAEEASYAVQLLGDLKLDFPLAYDWEEIEDDTARTDNVNNEQVTSCAKTFCEEVKKLGFTPMIYSESKEFYNKYDLSALKDYELWLSEYNDLPTFYYNFSMWQYSDKGKVDGINSDVDLNIFMNRV